VEVEGLDAINWAAPWLSPIAIDGLKLAAQEQWRDELNRLALERNVRGAGGHPIRFCRADAAGGEPYETFVARTGCVPTRANLHDYFNALMYLRFPKAKATLNALHASAIERDGITSTRGSARDAATLIDENALLLVTQRADLIEALRRHDWTALFVEQRSAWNADIRTLAFGHALLDKLVRPYKAITAHCLHVPFAADATLDEIDTAVARQLSSALSPSTLLPLPVMGIPGWCDANVDAAFYSDTRVFRPQPKPIPRRTFAAH